ncbi:uncharacterized protein LOC112688547 [Sipha flava]|uniref:Uncharacterized protein LOC112688547 n=1 Tax=Sipha flava TaxID=143950 RepID=A0A2S2PWW6_9HEMI|nr:uncharacterized protein LOC112688547 [Sipha flava]
MTRTNVEDESEEEAVVTEAEETVSTFSFPSTLPSGPSNESASLKPPKPLIVAQGHRDPCLWWPRHGIETDGSVPKICVATRKVVYPAFSRWRVRSPPLWFVTCPKPFTCLRPWNCRETIGFGRVEIEPTVSKVLLNPKSVITPQRPYA